MAKRRPTKSWYMDKLLSECNEWWMVSPTSLPKIGVFMLIQKASSTSTRSLLHCSVMVVWLWHLKWILLFNVKYFQLILCSPGLFLARTLTHLFIIKSHKLNFASHIISEVSYLNVNIDLECCNMQTRYIRVSFQLWNTSQDHDPPKPSQFPDQPIHSPLLPTPSANYTKHSYWIWFLSTGLVFNI